MLKEQDIIRALLKMTPKERRVIGEEVKKEVTRVKELEQKERKKLFFPQVLAKAITKVLPCVISESELDNFAFRGCENILFESEKSQLKIVATDGHEMAFTSIYVEENLPQGKWLLDRKTAKELKNELKTAEAVNLKIGVGDGNLHFEVFTEKRKPRVFSTFLGDFPIYQAAILKAFESEATFKAIDMKVALREAKGVRIVKLSLDSERQITQLSFAKIGLKEAREIETEIEGEIKKGPSLFILFNRTYLWKMAQTLGGEITLRAKDAYSPVLFEGKGINWLIMPIIKQ